jgi:IS605 OrfB family transposase
MELKLTIRLLPTQAQRQLLLKTIETFNCAVVSAVSVADKHGVSSAIDIQRNCYHEIRSELPLAAQMTIRAIAKASRIVSRHPNKPKRKTRMRGAIQYDSRVLSFKGDSNVSIWCIGGRQVMPIAIGKNERGLLGKKWGECDLIYRGGQFYLGVTTYHECPPKSEFSSVLGVDLGIASIATDSDSRIYSGGETMNRIRLRYSKARAQLQRKGTRGAKKILKKMRRSESSFIRHVNHVVSKEIVRIAKGTSRAIAIEDLRGIRSRVTVRRAQRHAHSGWAFSQLRKFIEYKAALAGVTVIAVNPRNTSRTCNACGYCSKSNRKSQSRFSCGSCGLVVHADYNAALNIASRAWAFDKQATKLKGP